MAAASFDFQWYGPASDFWQSNFWRHLYIPLAVQDANNWPAEYPKGGDDVFFTLPTASVIRQTQVDDCRELTVGALGESVQQLDVGGSLTIGVESGPRFCPNTRVSGAGLTNGSNSATNYVFIEARDGTAQRQSTGTGVPDDWLITMTASNGTTYSAQDFSYTLTNYGDGVFLLAYNASRRVTGFPLLYIYCGTTLLNGQPYVVPFYEVPPPSPVVAYYTQSGTGIFVNFSIPTNRAGFAGHFDCAALLDVAALTPSVPSVAAWVGAGGFCYFRTSNELYVQFGNQARPRVNSTIAFRGGVLAGVPPFATVPADPQSIAVLVGPRTDAPLMQLSVPRYVSPCSANVTLDCTASLGTTGRDWDALTWSVSSNASTAAIQPLLDAASGRFVVVLPAALFERGADYLFAVTARNFFGLTGSSAAATQVLADEAMQLNIAGGVLQRVRVDQEMLLAADVANPCNLSVVDYEFVWSGLDNYTRNWMLDVQAQTDVKNLWVPSGSLRLGPTLHLQLAYTVLLSDGSQLTTTDQVSVQIDDYSPVYAVVKSGTFRRIDTSVAFELDPTSSMDPSGSTQPFTYKWSCVRNTFPFVGQKCVPKPNTFFSTDRLQFKAGDLSGGQYLFRLVVSKPDPTAASVNGTRSDSLLITVDMVDTTDNNLDYGLPVVTINDVGTRFIQVQRPFALRGLVTGTNVANWSWTVEPPLDLSDPDVAWPLPDDEFGFILRPGAVESGVQYLFTLTAWNDIGYSFATLPLEGQLPPLAGRCSAVAQNITTTTTTTDGSIQLLPWRLACDQWETFFGENARTYEFGYVSPLTGRDVFLSLGPLIDGNADISVPYGTDTLLVQIRGSGGQTLTRLTIAIESPPLTIVTDPLRQVDPIFNSYAAVYASFGAAEQVIHSTLAGLEWLNYQGQTVDPLTNTSRPLFDVPITYTDQAAEGAFRSARQYAMANINALAIDAVNKYSVRTMAAIYAAATTASSSTDKNLLYATQRFPLAWMAWLPLLPVDDQTVESLLQGAWNQLIGQQYFFYAPGESIPLAQAVVDLLNNMHAAMQNDMIANQPDRVLQWKDLSAIMIKGYADELDLRASISWQNATVELGSELVSRFAGTGESEYAWGIVLSWQNAFIYEQSSEGIMSPVMHVQLIRPSTQQPFAVEGLQVPMQYILPTVPIYNPYHRQLLPGLDCVAWDSEQPAWSDSGITYNTTGLAADTQLWCLSTHLTEFAMRQHLAPIGGTNPGRTSDIGWWVFTAVLAFLLVLIVILAAVLCNKKRTEKDDEEEEFLAPEVVGVTREVASG